MIKASYDPKLNTVIIELSGHVDAFQMKQARPRIEAVLPKDRAGFKVLTDLTGVTSVDPGTQAEIKKLMDLVDAHGVSEVIRVIPDPFQDLGLNIMSNFHYSKNVKFLTFESRQEAGEALEGGS